MCLIKYFCLLFWVVGQTACNDTPKQEQDSVPLSHEEPKEEYKFDTLRFNKQYFPDTTGCYWYKMGRGIEYILDNEYAIVMESSVDTFLATSKYRRLWVCNLPPILLKPKDTLIISGTMYSISGNEGRKGWPTILTKVITKQPQ